jgi:hypothetical protein
MNVVRPSPFSSRHLTGGETEEIGRRSRGEGCICKRKDGRWCGKYIDANGKTRYVYGKTRAEVMTKLAKAIADKG